jgi:hypothetical protein
MAATYEVSVLGPAGGDITPPRVTSRSIAPADTVGAIADAIANLGHNVTPGELVNITVRVRGMS